MKPLLEVTDAPVLELSDVTVGYRHRPVLSDVNLDLHDGEMLAFLGPSGCGKTTLLRSVAGLHRISGGSIRLRGTTVDNGRTFVAPSRREIGLVPQEGVLFPHLSVSANIAYGLNRTGWPMSAAARTRRQSRVRELLELIGLPDYASARPSELSGGQQQRVALARALSIKPRMILLDEPFAALDTQLRWSIRTEVKDVLTTQGTASIIVTHDRAEALGMADRVAVVVDGSIEQIDTAATIYARPRNATVGLLVGDGVVLAADATGTTAQTIVGDVQLLSPGAGRGTVLLRPEQVSIAADADGGFTVAHKEFGGSSTSVTLVHHQSGDTVVAQQPSHSVVATIAVGDRVAVSASAPVQFFTG